MELTYLHNGAMETFSKIVHLLLKGKRSQWLSWRFSRVDRILLPWPKEAADSLMASRRNAVS